MTFAKFRILTSVFALTFMAISSSAIFAKSYTAKECLDQDFETQTQGNGSLFGALKHELEIVKTDCVIEAHETKYLYLKTSWKVDICREPIHLKKEQFKNTSVFKKSRKCSEDMSSEFCEQTKNLLSLFKDIGLIFAEGNRQSLESDHGKTYCAYLLVKEYLESDSVFISGQKNVFIDGLEGSYIPTVKKTIKFETQMMPEKQSQEIFKEVENQTQLEDKPVEASGSF